MRRTESSGVLLGGYPSPIADEFRRKKKKQPFLFLWRKRTARKLTYIHISIYLYTLGNLLSSIWASAFSFSFSFRNHAWFELGINWVGLKRLWWLLSNSFFGLHELIGSGNRTVRRILAGRPGRRVGLHAQPVSQPWRFRPPFARLIQIWASGLLFLSLFLFYFLFFWVIFRNSKFSTIYFCIFKIPKFLEHQTLM